MDKTYDELWHGLSGSHDLTMLPYCMSSQPSKNIELMLRFLMILTYGWNPKVVIYSPWIESLLIKVSINMYSQDRHHNISWVWLFKSLTLFYFSHFFYLVYHSYAYCLYCKLAMNTSFHWGSREWHFSSSLYCSTISLLGLHTLLKMSHLGHDTLMLSYLLKLWVGI